METIKPIDLDKITFKTSFRGYAPKDVHAYLHNLSQELEGLMNTQMQMRVEIDRLKNELQGYRGMESALKDALVVAQKAADETRVNAHKEAEVILTSAKQQAIEEQHVLASEVKSLMGQVDSLQKEKERFERQFRNLLQDHLRELDQLFTIPSAVVITHAAAETTAEEPAATEA